MNALTYSLYLIIFAYERDIFITRFIGKNQSDYELKESFSPSDGARGGSKTRK